MRGKILRRTVILTLLVAMFALTTVVEASPNYYFKFEFTDRVNHFEAEHYKGDTEQNWYFHVYNDGVTNVSPANILGYKMNRKGNNNVHEYDCFRGETWDTIKIPYQATVASDDIMYLGAKKDLDSTSDATLYANGAYNP